MDTPHPDANHPGAVPVAADRFARHGLDAAQLLTTLDGLPTEHLAGLEPTDDALEVHVAPIRVDPRGTLAGLFGVVGPPAWEAVAVCVGGRTDADDHGDATDVDIRALLTRSGELCVRIDDDGLGDGGPSTGEVVYPSPSGAAPSGLLVDCLHRILDLPCPGDPPEPIDVALGTWSQAMLVRLFDRGDLSWADAVDLHPGEPCGRGSAMPSVETLVEATFRSTEDWDWARVHRRARHGSITAALTADEASWMDTTMYARWVVSHLADPIEVADLLDSHDFCRVAAGLRAVVAGVDAWRDRLHAA